jgi:hypothetical protein
MAERVTFYTIANARYFPGLAALLNTLRLNGHEEELVVLDEGLTPGQRQRLAPHATLVELPRERLSHPALLKPYPAELSPSGVVVLIDSDMIVTRPLTGPLAAAGDGRIAVYSDHESSASRWFAEWEREFDLAAPPRRQRYVNAGFVAFSQERWPEFLARWRRACELVPLERYGELPRFVPRRTVLEGESLWAGDQDALNAILMSEIPEDAIALQPAHEQPDWLAEVELEDAQTLTCRYRGGETAILHFSLAPKPWEPTGWRRVSRNAYIELFPRVVLADDVALRLEPAELPPWLRDDARARAARLSLDALWRGRDSAERIARASAQRLPPPLRDPVLRLRDRLGERFST